MYTCMASLAGPRRQGIDGNGGFLLNIFSHTCLGIRTIGTLPRGAEFWIMDYWKQKHELEGEVEGDLWE